MVAFAEGESFLKSATFVADARSSRWAEHKPIGGSHHGLEIAYRIGDQLADSQSEHLLSQALAVIGRAVEATYSR